MKTFFLNLWINHKKKIIFLILVLIFAFIFFNKKDKSLEFGKLKTGNLVEIVSVSGNVEPAQESSLSFEKSGKIESINVKVGDKVRLGQVLASISGSNDYASILNAKANLQIAEANLSDAKNGASEIDIKVKEDNIKIAKNNLSLAYSSIPDTLSSIYTGITDVLNNKLNNFFTFNFSYKFNFTSCDQGIQTKSEDIRYSLDAKILALENLKNNSDLENIQDLNILNKKVDDISTEVYTTNLLVSNLLNNLDKIVNSSCLNSSNNISLYRENLSKARTQIDNLILNINNLKSQINTLRNNLSTAEISLSQLKAGITAEKIKSLEAGVNVAKANLILAEANNSKNTLKAPFNGIITEIKINLGEISSPNISAIKIISENDLELKVKLAEVDLFKIKLQNKTKINLDTYGDSVNFEGIVSQIDPAATTEGKSNSYFAKINFLTQDDKIKSGMNGSAEIVVNEKTEAKYIDAKYLKVKNKDNFVRILKNEKYNSEKDVEERKIEIGIKDKDGKVEIISGLNENDKLLIWEESKY